MTKIPKDIQDKFAAESATTPATDGDGLTAFERAQLKILEKQAAAKTPAKPDGKQYGWRHVFLIVGLPVFFIWLIMPSEDERRAERKNDQVKAQIAKRECDAYTKAIGDALPSFNGDAPTFEVK